MPPVQSVVRSIHLLQEVAKRPLGLVDLARTADLPTTTAARLLATLVEIDALQRLDDGTYRVGPAITALAVSGDRQEALCGLARPHMVELAATLDESVGLSLPAGDEVVTVAQVDAQRPVNAEDWSGTRWPMDAPGAGDVFLAHLPDAEVDAHLAGTIDPEATRARIAVAREAGVAWSHGDYVADLSSVAAAVRDHDGRAIAALYAYGPSYRFPEESGVTTIEQALVTAAERVSAAWSARRRQLDAA